MCSLSSRLLKRIYFKKGRVFHFSTSAAPDLQSLFLTPRIHNLLHGLVSVSQPTKIHESGFRVEKVHDIKLLSNTELQMVMQYSKMLTSQKLQMPPVMNERSPDDRENSIITQNPELCGILPANQKLAFVDIGLDSSRRRRLMLVRESDGTLRHAHSSERDRLNQIFFPLPGRRLRTPSLFRDSNLEVALKNGLHEYVLDLILIQFEPDSPEYIRISQRVYRDAAAKIWACYTTTSDRSSGDDANIISRLRLTRHYGPFVLYVISRLQRPDCLVQEALFHQALGTVYKLLILTSLLHPHSDFAMKVLGQGIPPSTPEGDHFVPVSKTVLDIVRTFIGTWPLEPEQRNQLDLSLAQCSHFDETNTTNMNS